MPPVALAARVVEVIADLGPAARPRFRYGSGFIVRAGTVLTAAHVVAGAVSVSVRDPDKRTFPASADPSPGQASTGRCPPPLPHSVDDFLQCADPAGDHGLAVITTPPRPAMASWYRTRHVDGML
jgi:hypothetical protein